MRTKLAVAFVIASIACTASLAHPADETQVLTFSLKNATGPEAATVLRTIVGVKSLQAVDDHAITVRDTQEKLDLAAAVVEMLDATDDTTPLSAGDGSIIAAAALSRASLREVMLALRELQIARIATAGEKMVFLRDTDSQVQAALEVIGKLERGRP